MPEQTRETGAMTDLAILTDQGTLREEGRTCRTKIFKGALQCRMLGQTPKAPLAATWVHRQTGVQCRLRTTWVDILPTTRIRQITLAGRHQATTGVVDHLTTMEEHQTTTEGHQTTTEGHHLRHRTTWEECSRIMQDGLVMLRTIKTRTATHLVGTREMRLEEITKPVRKCLERFSCVDKKQKWHPGLSGFLYN